MSDEENFSVCIHNRPGPSRSARVCLRTFILTVRIFGVGVPSGPERNQQDREDCRKGGLLDGCRDALHVRIRRIDIPSHAGHGHPAQDDRAGVRDNEDRKRRAHPRRAPRSGHGPLRFRRPDQGRHRHGHVQDEQGPERIRGRPVGRRPGWMRVQRPERRTRQVRLDAVGNTTAAVGKGFCTGSATFTALALVLSYGQVSGLIEDFTQTNHETLMTVDITPFVIGILIGAMVPFLFSALVINSVGKAANKMVLEIRRQFAKHPKILTGKEKPDYNRCIDIATRASLKEMILPGVIAVVTPILIGVLLGKAGLGALLIGALASSVMLAIFMANSGGAWDNAKKYIEQLGLKGTEEHHASVTGDTVGDPLKDTAGPTMDILIKLMSVIALIMAPMLQGGFSVWSLIVK